MGIAWNCSTTSEKNTEKQSQDGYRIIMFNPLKHLKTISNLFGVWHLQRHMAAFHPRMKEFDKAMAEKSALMADAEKCQNKLNMAQRHLGLYVWFNLGKL